MHCILIVIVIVKGTMSAGGHAQWSLVQTNLHMTRRGIIDSLPLRPSCRSHLLTHGDTFSRSCFNKLMETDCAVVESVSHELS